jgi:hypothetical protein
MRGRERILAGIPGVGAAASAERWLRPAMGEFHPAVPDTN